MADIKPGQSASFPWGTEDRIIFDVRTKARIVLRRRPDGDIEVNLEDLPESNKEN